MANMEATSNIYFSWSRNVSLELKAAETPKDPVNLVATSSRFGLIFIAGGSELHCTSVADVQSEHSIDKILPDSTTHVFLKVQAGGVISGVFMSADETTVAVCTENLFCHLFDTRAFFDKTPHPVGPYFTVRLASSPEVVLKDFAFNPVIPDMFAVVMSDGKVTNYEVAGSNGHFTLKIHGSYAGGKCCSWSPKGKQLVVAREDGSLIQLKPTMAEAKTISAPSLPELVNPRPKTIFWASSTVFVVAYWTNRLHIVVTTVSKNAPPQYVLFEEPCLRNLDEEEFSRTWFCHVPKWNLLLMVCRNSPDVALFGHNENCTQWVYYDIEGERAALPLIGKTATYPTGICLNLSSTAVVEKKNQPTKPPSPLVLLSNTGGCLTPYYLMNDSAAERINCPPEARNTHGMRTMLNPLATTPKSQTETPLAAPLSKSKINLLKQFEKHEAEQDKTASANLAPQPTPFSFSPAVQTPLKLGSASIMQSTPMAATTFLGDKPKPFPTLTNPAGFQTNFAHPFAVPAVKPQEVPKMPLLPAPTAAVNPPTAATNPPPVQSMATMVSAAQTTRKTSPAKAAPKLESLSQSVEEDESLSRETLSRAFFSELNSMTKELDDLKLRSAKVLALPIGKNEGVTQMRSEFSELQTKMDNVRTDLKSMKTDVHEAQKMIIDALACGAQLKTVTVAKDSRISRMDPITQATLKQAQGLAHYLERQLINANNVLDDAHEKYNNEKNTRKHVPTLEMLRRTILSCDKTIEVLRDELDAVKNKIDRIKRMQSLRERSKEDLTSLADSLLVVGVESEDANKTQKHSDKNQSYEKIKSLKDYLASRPVTEVTPTKLSPQGESMIVSKLSTILEQSRIEIEAEKGSSSTKNVDNNLNPLTMPRESIGGILCLRPNLESSATTPMKPLAKATSTPFAKPILEPISPPANTKEVSKPAVSSAPLFAFQSPSSKTAAASTFLAFPKTSTSPQTVTNAPQSGFASSAKTFSFELQKTPETQAASVMKPKVTFSFEAPTTPKSNDPDPEPTLSKPSASPGSMFTFATSASTLKTQTAAPGTDFSFAVKKDPSPSKNFFSPSAVGFSLVKKEEALTLATSPPRTDSPAANQTGPQIDKPVPTTAAQIGATTFSFALGDKKQGSTTTTGEPGFQFSFISSKSAEKSEASEAVVPTASPFKLGDSSAKFSFGSSASVFGQAAAGDGGSRSATSRATEPPTAEKSALPASTYSFSLTKDSEKADASAVSSSEAISTGPTTTTRAEATKETFGFGFRGNQSAAFSLSKAADEVADTATKVTSEPATVPEVSPAAEGREVSARVPEVEEPATEAVKQDYAAMVKEPTGAAEAEPTSRAAEVPALPVSSPISTAPTALTTTVPTTTSFFAANKPLNLESALPSTGTAAPGGGLFGKAPSGGLFGSSGGSTFGQSSAFGTSTGTSFFGGSSTTASTPLFGGASTTGAAPAAPGSMTTSAASWLTAAASQAAADSSAAKPATPTGTLTPQPLFGSTNSAFGQSSVFGAQTSAFAPTTSSAFAASTTSSAFTAQTAPAFGSVSAFSSPATTTTPAFGQAVASPTFEAPAPAFGAQQKPQSELFGKPTTQNTGLFGQKSSFGGSPVRASVFGGSGSPSTGGFMGGLGQPGAQTTKNVFGGGTFGQSTQSTNLFGGGGASTFGGQPSYGNVSNMGGMAPKESPFGMGSPGGAKPVFGGAPAFGGASPGGFGSPPTFGSAPVFGASPAFGGGGTQATTFGGGNQPAAFGNTANTPTFGSIAQNQSPFGNAAPSGGFGAASPTQGFPAPVTTPPKSAAFTQYRG